jgi:2-polyprenyl-3-methyl-5-hydroxy-6-metoxy-1,4-benzoquinol methylase
MVINKLTKITGKPELYTKGKNVMWTDSYISKQLLQIHLNENIDLASRKKTSILETIKWILTKVNKNKLNILDLGCGPGLYSEELAKLGHRITGIDISMESIEYAKKAAAKSKLDIFYKTGNYLDTKLGYNEFDLVIMIYTDFGVLDSSERKLLLNNVRKALKPEGHFIFDVLNEKCLAKTMLDKTWECEEKGFWSDNPYLHLTNSYLYKKEKVILYQHFIADDDKELKTYRFWTHFFSHDDLIDIMRESKFKVLSLDEDVLPKSDQWNGENVTFITSIAE